MRILVTGGTGFVGSAVVQSLAAAGHEVVATYRSSPDRLAREFIDRLGSEVSLVSVDITDRESLTAVLQAAKPDVVVHAAVLSTLSADAERADPQAIIQTNILGTANAMREAAAADVSRFVYVSSSAVFPPGRPDDDPIPEDAPTAPTSLYGISKLASESTVRRLGALFGVETVSVRIAQPYGPMERATVSRPITSPIHEWISAARSGQPLRVPSSSAGKDWTYIADTADGIARVATASVLPHDVYHLSVGRNWTVDEVVGVVRPHFPSLHLQTVSDSEINPNISPHGLKGPLSSERMRTDLDFQCAVDLSAGVSTYLAWLVSEGASETLLASREAQ